MNQHVYETAAAGAIAYTFAPGKSVHIREVRLHLSAAGGAAESFTMKSDSALGAAYDIQHASQDMNALTDYVFRPTNGFLFLAKGDELDFAWANSNNRTWGLEILFS